MSFSETLTVISLVISVGAVLFSIISYINNKNLALKGFSRNFRPYVFAGNFGYVDSKDNKYYTQMNVLMISILNAPSKLISKNLSFFIREDNKDTLLFSHPEYLGDIAYPFEKGQMTINTSLDIISHEKALELKKNGKVLVRKARIDYKWISDESEIYYYDGEWIYNTESHNWDTVRQLAKINHPYPTTSLNSTPKPSHTCFMYL